MYNGRQKPKPAELAALGLLPEDMAADEPVVEVWPVNWPACEAFSALGSQWRMSFSGPSGLDYSAIEPTFRLMQIPTDKWPQLFSEVRLMEGWALEKMRETAEIAATARGSA